MIFHFPIVQVHFFCQLNFILLFPHLIKFNHIVFILLLYLDYLVIDLNGLLIFVPASLLYILTPLVLLSSSVYLISFLLFPCVSV